MKKTTKARKTTRAAKKTSTRKEKALDKLNLADGKAEVEKVKELEELLGVLLKPTNKLASHALAFWDNSQKLFYLYEQSQRPLRLIHRDE